MDVLDLGRQLLLLGTILCVAVFATSLAAVFLRSRRLVITARTGIFVLFIFVGGATACLTYGFVAGLYNTDYVYSYSEKYLPLGFKLAGVWAGLDGSLLFWTFLLCIWSTLAALLSRSGASHSTGRRLEPYLYAVLSSIILFFCFITWREDPFKVMSLEVRLKNAGLHSIPMDSAGNLLDGAGLNQQLVNYWFVIHPPTLYLGFTAWTIPFAYAMAALLAGELGDYWIRIVRRWSMVAWMLLTSGIILGGLWAYRQLGWGGYWAWDPVENASFLPWLTGTAFLHSIMIQERRDMLKGWNVFLIILTFFLTIVGTWMTRSGVVNSVHAFAGGDIGVWFQGFLFAIAGLSLFFFFFRYRQLRGTQGLESIFSREAAFFLNNLVLVIIAAAVFFLSFYDKISHDWFGKDLKNPGIFNLTIAPLFAVLLFLTAIGPGLGWVKSSPRSLWRNFAIPVAGTCLFLICLYGFFAWQGMLGSKAEVFNFDMKLPPEKRHPTALYPTGLFLGLAFFICSTVTYELWRAVRGRVVHRKEGLATSLLQVVFRQNRRYGGYTVHIGIAILTAGIIASSMFKVKAELALKVGESARVGPYTVTPIEEKLQAEPRPGEPYRKDEVVFRVTRPASGALPAAHGASDADAGAAVAAETVAELRTERRFYPKRAQWISEVSIERHLLEDIYIYYAAKDEAGRHGITVFLNPLMFLIYIGWFVMIGGALLAALPLSGSKVGLAE